MEQIPLINEPNQEFSVTFEEITYNIRIRALDKIMLMDISVDDTPIITGGVCYANQWVIPYSYLISKGNFFWSTLDENYPFYADFDKTCFLYYITAEELKEAENG